MECWICERPSQGMCVFCGRAICKEHHKVMPNLITIFEGKEQKKGIVVDNALFCGECSPREEPVPLEGLE